MKGRMFSQIYNSSKDYKDLRELGFVLKCNAVLRKLMKDQANEIGEIDYGKLQKEWDKEYSKLLKEELSLMDTAKGKSKK